MQMPSNFDHKSLFAISLCLMVFGIIFGFFLFPKFLQHSIKSQITVAPGSKVRPFYEKTPFFLNFRVYVFNVTNKDEMIQGKKPKLQEIGPYFFEEWKEKYELVDDEEEDTLTYHYKNTFIFRPDLSGPGLTGDERVVLPHPLIMGMLLAVNVDKQPMLPMVEGALNLLFHNPTDAFYTGRVMDLLYDGVEVDCSSGDNTVKALCLNFDAEKAFRKIDDTHYAFSMFSGVNGTDLGEMKVLRGKKNHKDIGRVLTFNGEPATDAWDEDECNAYVGTDTTVIPSLMAPGEEIWGYDPSVCRSLGIGYVGREKYNGIPVSLYKLDLTADINVKPCFCRDEDTCPPRGTFDLFRCGGIPMYASLPHFYMAEQLLSGIESGLNPNETEHGIKILLEALTGTPLSAAKRLQFSLEVKPIMEIEMMKNMPEVILPLFWVEESAHLDRDFTDPIKNSLYLMITIVAVLKWLLVGLGSFGCLGAGAWMIIGEGI